MTQDLRCKLLVALIVSGGLVFQWWLLDAIN